VPAWVVCVKFCKLGGHEAGHAGWYPPAEAAEIRAALRAMPQAERDRTISDAIERGDAAVIASVQRVSPLLIGPLTVPVESLTNLYLDRHAPEMRSQLEAVEAAATNLSFAASAFKRAAEDMRDLARISHTVLTRSSGDGIILGR
jgi:hypothetical protein